MENNLKKNYYNKANDLFERLVDEAPEDNEENNTEKNPPEEEEKGQAQKIEIYYSNLNKETREVLINAVREALNATEDDKIVTSKIEEAMAKEPLVTLIANELVRKLKIQI